MKIEVGKKYELNNGEVHRCYCMCGNDPLHVDRHGHGPFVIDCVPYHQDGRFASYDTDHKYSVKREWTEDDDLNAICDERQDDPFVSASDKPKTWGEMTDAEKDGWRVCTYNEWKYMDLKKHEVKEILGSDMFAYRAKPSPVVETVTMYTGKPSSDCNWGWTADNSLCGRTHRLTFTTTDGKPATGTFTNENGDVIIMEEV